jgi:PhoPQ-activated pathogenicity-related protein
MTRSAIRAMDAVQGYTAKQGRKVERFFVTGASKRGWTTWLTAAADPRVIGFAPMVIDMLNVEKQMPHQVKSFGGYSEQIHDYTDAGLQKLLGTADGKRLLALVDPYSYKEKLVQPKLVVLGTNDRYWPVDAVKLYFDDLPGEKYIHYVPNAGHGLGPSAVAAIKAFYHQILTGTARPRFEWKVEAKEDAVTMTIAAKDAPKAVELWRAESGTRDFRDATWTPVALEGAGGKWVARVERREKGFKAVHVSLVYPSGLGHDYKLSTNVEVIKPLRVWY